LRLKQEMHENLSGSDSGIDAVSGLLAYSVVATATLTDVSAALASPKYQYPFTSRHGVTSQKA